MKKFDLNIEKVLENWETYHAIREIIANAIDEQILTGTKDIQIFQDKKGYWHIQDFGRGLNYEHLTQKENDEKLKNPHLIGKFGVGIKDALATFERRGIKVFIKSPHGDITLGKSQKHDFDDITTLHAYISLPSDNSFVGTEFILDGCRVEDMKKAKDLFLRFSKENILERTQYGEILEKKELTTARIYINGVKIAEEENFLFSYNITSLTQAIKKTLNRERNNVGRIAYSERVKAILLACKEKNVMERLSEDLEKYQIGSIHDELKWSNISVHASKILNASQKVVFFTPDELADAPDMVDKVRDDGFQIVTVPCNVREKMRGETDLLDNPIRDLTEFKEEWNNSFQFKFIGVSNLNPAEKEIFKKTEDILELVGGRPEKVREIKISETMRMENEFKKAIGLWEEETGRIIIERKQLRDFRDYAGTLLHEIAHAISGASDVSSEFETCLTELLGKIVSDVNFSKIKVEQR